MKPVTTGTLFPRSVGKLHLFRSSGPIIGITADGFYEWTKISKLPPLLHGQRRCPICHRRYLGRANDMPRCFLLTTAANAVLEPIHDRMPVIVRRNDWEDWFLTRRAWGTGFSVHHDSVQGRGIGPHANVSGAAHSMARVDSRAHGF